MILFRLVVRTRADTIARGSTGTIIRVFVVEMVFDLLDLRQHVRLRRIATDRLHRHRAVVQVVLAVGCRRHCVDQLGAVRADDSSRTPSAGSWCPADLARCRTAGKHAGRRDDVEARRRQRCSDANGGTPGIAAGVRIMPVGPGSGWALRSVARTQPLGRRAPAPALPPVFLPGKL